MRPCLYIVATPIGNLDDLTVRARHTLRDADLILAEDTRRARQLLSHLEIGRKPLIAYHDHTERQRADTLVSRILSENLAVALVSDAGTPCVSDPGYRLVAAAKAAGIKVVPVAGPSAVTALVSASGLPSDRFCFIGFLPSKGSALSAEIESWDARLGSVVFFIPTRRLKTVLAAISERFPAAEVAVGRELTKMYEEILTRPIGDVMQWVDSHATLKGEATVMVYLGKTVAGASDEGSINEEMLRAEFKRGATLKDLLQKYAKSSGLSRSELYQLLLRAKS